MKRNTVKKLEKYKFIKGSIILMGIIIVIALITYIALLIKSDLVGQELGTIIKDVVKNVLIMVISVFGSSLLSCLIIEKNNNNSMYFDTIVNDVVSSKLILDNLSEKNKKEIEKYIKKENNPVKIEMMDEIQNKFRNADSKYYFEKCSYVVECTVEKDFIKKRIQKDITIRSYDDTHKIKDFEFVSVTSKPVEGIEENLRIISISIDGRSLGENDYEIETKGLSENERILRQSNYTQKYICKYKAKLSLQSNQGKRISIEYETCVEKSDTSYSCRLSEHCKEMSVDFTVSGEVEYVVKGNAYGFMDSANKTQNGRNGNHIKFELKDWSFKDDGVFITFAPKH